MTTKTKSKTKTKPPLPAPTIDNIPADLHVKIYIRNFWEIFQTLSAGECRALLALLMRIDHGGEAFPGHRRAAADAGRTSRQHSRNMLRRLEAKGVIEIERHENISHDYRVNPAMFGIGGGDDRTGKRGITKVIRGGSQK
jgi:hypothetical protein